MNDISTSQTFEILALLTGIGYALLVVKRSRWAWVSGALSSMILAVLAAQAALPLQSALQASYVLMAGYGFWHWSRAEGEARKIVVWPLRWHLLAVVVTALVAWAAAPWLATAGAAWPALDAAVTVISLLATWMTARVVLENWIYWLLVDSASFFLYASQGLTFVAALYAIYFLIALYGLRSWYRAWRAA